MLWPTLFVEAWQKASDVAHAYTIGKYESEAATNLLNHCDDAVVDALGDLVKSLCLTLRNCEQDLLNGPVGTPNVQKVLFTISCINVRSQCNQCALNLMLSVVAFFQECPSSPYPACWPYLMHPIPAILQ